MNERDMYIIYRYIMADMIIEEELDAIYNWNFAAADAMQKARWQIEDEIDWMVAMLHDNNQSYISDLVESRLTEL